MNIFDGNGEESRLRIGIAMALFAIMLGVAEWDEIHRSFQDITVLFMFILIIIYLLSAFYHPYKEIIRKEREITAILQKDEWEDEARMFDYCTVPWFVASTVRNMSAVFYTVIVSYAMKVGHIKIEGDVSTGISLVMFVWMIICGIIAFGLASGCRSLIPFDCQMFRKYRINTLRKFRTKMGWDRTDKEGADKVTDETSVDSQNEKELLEIVKIERRVYRPN